MSRPSALLEANGAARSLLVSAAAEARVAVFCGIPGVGKSLLLREQHELALQAGRRVSRLHCDRTLARKSSKPGRYAVD